MRLDLNPLRFSAQEVCEKQVVSSNKALYFSLLNDLKTESLKDSSMTFLEEHIFQLKTQLKTLDHLIPIDEASMVEWFSNHATQIGEQYQQYLNGSAHGEARRYFTNKSHALFLIK